MIYAVIIAESCPYGTAWADKAYAADTAHQPAECSGAGTCDYKAGKCKCFNGFTGIACQRSNESCDYFAVSIILTGCFRRVPKWL